MVLFLPSSFVTLSHGAYVTSIHGPVVALPHSVSLFLGDQLPSEAGVEPLRRHWAEPVGLPFIAQQPDATGVITEGTCAVMHVSMYPVMYLCENNIM